MNKTVSDKLKSCFASLCWMTSEILQLHVRSVEKQLSVKNMCKHFFYKARFKAMCLECVSPFKLPPFHETSVLISALPGAFLLVFLQIHSFWICLILTLQMESICAQSSQLELSSHNIFTCSVLMHEIQYDLLSVWFHALNALKSVLTHSLIFLSNISKIKYRTVN